MEQEYYYNPQTNETFSKTAASKVAVPDNFSKVDKSVFDTFTNQGAKPMAKPVPINPPFMPNLPMPSPQPERTLTDPSEFIQAQVGARVNQPFLPQGTAVTPGLALQTPTAATMQTTPGLTGEVASAVPTVTAPTVQAQDVSGATQVSQQPQVTAPQYQAVTGVTTPQAIAAQGTVSQPMVAAQEDITALPPEATVQGQLANISQAIQQSVDEGKPLPAYAQGAKRIVDAAMQQRGLGASSIAAEALAQGIVNASVPIAKADADTYKQAIFANLNNRQQVSLANVQLRQQGLLSDQSAENAARQFNAVSQRQTDQFFTSLSNQINTNNATRTDAMNQFATAERSKVAAMNANNEIAVNQANAQREAAINQFNAQLKDQRERFNVENQRVIDQSNVTWRRQINTANTASINAANQTDAQNLLQISNFALSSLWQQWRDEASWINQSSENAQDRAHNIAMAALDRELTMELLDQKAKSNLNRIIGEIGLEIIEGMF